MKRRGGLVLVGLVIVGLAILASAWWTREEADAAATGFASPINGGCYIAAPSQCRLHVDPFTININDGAGARLMQFTLYANGNPIYAFTTDVSNPPNYDYTPSPVALDFAARCGETYVMNLVAQDTTDANPLNYGQTGSFTCPAMVP
jgi:hypothetical protein